MAGRAGGHQDRRGSGQNRRGGDHRGQQRGHAASQRRGQGRERGYGNEGGRHNPARSGDQRGRGPRDDSGPRRARPNPDAARLAALEALTRVREDGAYANLVLPPILDAARLDRRDAGFATALAYGALRLSGRYDAILARCIDRPLERVDGVVLDALRLGAHQLLGMRVPSHAAVSATVELAAHAAGRGASSFVNAVLRKVAAKDLDAWLAEAREAAPDELTALAAVESHPVWIAKALRQALVVNGRDPGELTSLLAADNADPEVVLCARPGLIETERLAVEARRAVGDEPRLGDTSPYAVVLPGGDPGRIPAVRSSRAGVEDEGSQLIALMASEPAISGRDERWLDMCAGPGGKAALLAARAAQRGVRLTANEVAPHRARLVEAAVRAIPDGVVDIRCGDGRQIGLDEPGRYDRVLVDAPCTGLGSLRRRPEARWRRDPKDVTELAALQRQLLLSALSAVRRGGLVAYVTCSPHALETSLVVKDALSRATREGMSIEALHAGNAATRIAPRPPAGADREQLQLWPHLDGTDAMFCALLRRDR